MKALRLQIKRIYEPPTADDGARVLVDRLWPRGVRKQAAELTVWMKDVAPSPELRKWFNHDPARSEEFGRRYRAELIHNSAADQLNQLLLNGPVTLLYAARDPACNHARVLADYLTDHFRENDQAPAS